MAVKAFITVNAFFLFLSHPYFWLRIAIDICILAGIQVCFVEDKNFASVLNACYIAGCDMWLILSLSVFHF